MAYTLPTQKTKKRIEPSSLKIALYGTNGIGKTPWAAQAEDYLYVAIDPAEHVEGYIEEVRSWTRFHDICFAFKAGGHPYKGMVIDTGPGLYRLLEEHLCAINKPPVNDISKAEGGWGKGKRIAQNIFFRYIQELAFLPYGLIFISHAREFQVTPDGGEAYTAYKMDLPEEVAFQIKGLFSQILFCQRVRAPSTEDASTPPWVPVIRTAGSPQWEARDRHGFLPASLMMDPQPNRDGYSLFVKEFVAGRERKEKEEKSTFCQW